MDIKDQIKQVADRVNKLKTQIQTEEATKNAFIMPFIQILGHPCPRLASFRVQVFFD
jgi:hypothetical protein